MNTIDRLERDLSVWFAQTAVPQTPPYIDDILRQTASLGQRPRWTFLERHIPMTTIASFRALTSPVPWRTIGVLALLLVALVIGALIAGSRQRQLPAPFGIAEPGLVAYASEGDIYVVDPSTNEPRAIVTGAETDQNPTWSRDGTQLVFDRLDGVARNLFAVRPDGSDLVQITPESMGIATNPAAPDFTFAPDGKSVLFVANGTIHIAQTDGSGIRTLEASGLRIQEAAFRPPDGRQVGAIATSGGVYLIDVTTGVVTTLIGPETRMVDESLSWSPDGSQLAYHRFSTGVSEFTVRGHILDVASGADRLADPTQVAPWDAQVNFSNDGQRISLFRGYTVSGYADLTLAILPASGSGPGIETAHGAGVATGFGAVVEWAPDDHSILLSPVDTGDRPLPQVLIDPDTASVNAAPWNAIGDPAWQRLAP
jgi:dipeptidyl aminopeptidase/acylaminoacyl peptidase